MIISPILERYTEFQSDGGGGYTNENRLGQPWQKMYLFNQLETMKILTTRKNH